MYGDRLSAAQRNSQHCLCYVQPCTVLFYFGVGVSTKKLSLYRHEYEFLDNRHMKVVRLSALRTDRLYPLRKIPATAPPLRLFENVCYTRKFHIFPLRKNHANRVPVTTKRIIFFCNLYEYKTNN